ncbi:MAG: ATP-binding protein, partial [Phycisphaerae bacterium]
ITLCVFVVSGVAAYLRVQREIGLFEREIRRDHELAGADLAAAVQTIWRLAGEEAALAYVDELNEGKGHVLIRWVWPDAVQGAPAGPRAAREQITQLKASGDVTYARVEEGGHDCACTYVASVTPTGRLGAIELSESLADEKAYVRTTLVRTAIVTIVILLLCGLFTMALGALVVGRPVRLLIDKARRVAAGNLSGRLEISPRDELGQLAGELNAMSDQLADAQQRLIAEVSARRTTTEQLRHAERLTTVGNLASGIAHELGTPLNIILARARMIADEDLQEDRAREYAGIIADQATRISAAIRQLLSYARRQAPSKSATDLRNLIRQTAELLEPEARKAGVCLNTELPEQPLIAAVDRGQIGQVLSNLVLNGIQAMPEGGDLTIGIEPAPSDDGLRSEEQGPRMLRVSVRDEGIGIPPDNLKHLFEPFFTSKAADGGTGLGLSVAADIVQEHGGHIEVHSEVGNGTCFYVYLPAETSQCQAVS